MVIGPSGGLGCHLPLISIIVRGYLDGIMPFHCRVTLLLHNTLKSNWFENSSSHKNLNIYIAA